jgi:type I restriction enzyme M protein
MPKASAHRRAFGQYFTPASVVACAYALLEGHLPAAPRIADPACGDGAFLLAARDLAPNAELAGCDLDPALVAQLQGAGLAGVRCADGLDPASLPAGAFDAVVGNPPFGVRTSRRAPLASEVRFLLRALELARPGGLVALVLPNGVLANERLRDLRAGLLARNTVLAVVALPRGTFYGTGTTAACSLLLLRTAAPPPEHQIFFALPETLEELPAVVAAFRGGAAGRQPECFWMAQQPGLLRLDAAFWRPAARALIERMAARWPVQPLGALLGAGEVIAGDHVRPSRGEARGAGLPYEYYQTREFLPAGYNYARLERCDARAHARLRHTAVQQHDILVSCAGVGGAGRGRVCLLTHRPGASCTGDVLIIRPRAIDPVFLFLFLASHAGRGQLLRLQNGVGTVNLSVDELLQVQVPQLAPAEQCTLAVRYAPVAAAHDAAMAALAAGDAAAYAQARAHAEALLGALLAELEALVLG